MSYVKPTFLRYIRLFLLVVFLVPTFLSGQQAIWMEAIESWEKDVLLTPDDKIARLDSIREVAQREAPQPGFFLRLHQFLARQYYVTQRYDSAAHHFEQNRQWAARQSDQAEWMRASWNAAHMFLLQGKLAEAQTRYLEIHHHYSLQQDTLGLAEVSGAIGNVYFQNQAYGQALDRYQAAMRWWSHIEEVRDRFFTLHQMAKTYQRLDSLPQAEYWYRHLLAQYTSLLPFDEKFLVERNLSAVMRQQGKYRQALSLQLAAYHRNKASLDEELSMMIHHSLGLSYRDLGRYDSALCYLDLALEYVAQKKQLTSISLIEESRYSCLSELGRFREALQALERHIAIE
ncbi:MAG: tetratricopeptide repeat protein, partial [Bacteroidota bacterium]